MVRQGILSFGLTLCLLAGVNAEPTVKEISPPDTGAGIVTARGPHRLLVDTEAPSNGLLLVTLGGTNSKPSDLSAIGDLAGRLGYKVAALDYPNSVISTKAREVGFPDGFTEFREEVVVGTPVSPIVEVDATNSIENRLLALLMSGDTDFAEFFARSSVTPAARRLSTPTSARGSRRGQCGRAGAARSGPRRRAPWRPHAAHPRPRR